MRLTTWRTAALTISAAALTVTATGCSTTSAVGEGTHGYTLRVGFISTTATPSGPEGWAAKSGALIAGLRSSGVGKIKWIPFKNGPDLSAALSGGSLDLSILGDTPALTARANGIATRLVNQSAVGQDTWLFAAKNGPRTVAELKGKTIATQVGSYMYRYLVALLQKQGISDTVKITHIYTANALPALNSGGIAAYAAPAGVLAAALAAHGFPLLDKASADHRDLLGTSVTVISTAALKAHPELPAAWNAVRRAAVADITGKPAAYYAFAAKATGTSADVVRTSLPVTVYHPEPFTAGGLALLDATNGFLATNKLDKGPVDLAGWRLP